jgi:hypothetical protein
MAKTKKENGTKQPKLHEIIDKLDAYREQLSKSPKVGSMKFQHMQSALHCYGAEREKNAVAWMK